MPTTVAHYGKSTQFSWKEEEMWPTVTPNDHELILGKSHLHSKPVRDHFQNCVQFQENDTRQKKKNPTEWVFFFCSTNEITEAPEENYGSTR